MKPSGIPQGSTKDVKISTPAKKIPEPAQSDDRQGGASAKKPAKGFAGSAVKPGKV